MIKNSSGESDNKMEKEEVQKQENGNGEGRNDMKQRRNTY